MREILFRGKRKDNGEWVYGCLFKQYIDCIDCWHIAEDAITANDYSEILGSVDIIPDTVGQYTGLTDKNGTRIFEGDIVKTKEYGRDCGNGLNCAGYDTFLVKFDGGHYCLTNKNRVFYLTSNSKVEVIGNIHDNPELLDGGDNGEKV